MFFALNIGKFNKFGKFERLLDCGGVCGRERRLDMLEEEEDEEDGYMRESARTALVEGVMGCCGDW